MKVLFLCPWLPWPLNSGGKIRTYNLIRAATELGAEVHLRAILEPDQGPEMIEEVRRVCTSLVTFERRRPDAVMRWSRPKIERWFHSPALGRHVEDELSSGDWDLVHLDELLLARVLRHTGRVPVVQHHHKLDTVLYATTTAHKGAQRHFDLWKLRRLEAYAAGRFRNHLLCSEEDAENLRTRHPKITCGVLPSGYDPEYFQPSDPPPERERDLLLFVGSMAYEPNVDAVVRFAELILPRIRVHRPNACLEIVGREPTPEVLACASDHVVVTGEVPDVRPYFARAAALVVPLRIGGGTRLKIVEAMGMGCPVVSTSIGAEGLVLEHARELAVSDEPDNFADRTAALLADPKGTAAMAQRAQLFVREQYPWEVLGKNLVEYWHGVADGE